MTSRFVCIGVPYWMNESMESDTELKALRDRLPTQLGAEWVEVKAQMREDEAPVTSINRAIAEAIATHSDRIPLIFTPNCINALGILKGLESHRPDVLWLDAHGDFNTPETTRSGFLGGMPVAALVGRGNEDLMRGIGLSPLREDQITLSDARNLDPEEGDLLRSSQVKHFPHINEIQATKWANKPLYIHLDTDVIDPSDMPALSYQEPNGPSLAETETLMRQVVQSANLAGAYVSLWDAALPGAEQAQAATFRLIAAITSGVGQ